MTSAPRRSTRSPAGTLLGLIALTLAVGVAWLVLDEEGSDGSGSELQRNGASRLSFLNEGAASVARSSVGEASPIPLPPPATSSEELAMDTDWPEGVVEICMSGRVVDVRGRPWPGASVVFVPDSLTSQALEGLPGAKPQTGTDPLAGLPRCSTDAEGHFRLCGPWLAELGGRSRHSGDLDPGVMVTAEGMAWQGHPAAGFTGGTQDLGDLVLAHPGASLAVRVLDERGTPLAGVSAVPYSTGYQSPADDDPSPPGRMSNALLGITGSDGRLLAEHRWPGDVRFALNKAGHDQLDLRASLSSGEHLDLGDVVLREGWSLHGTVTDTRGTPVADAELIVLGSHLARQLPDPATGDVDVTGLLQTRSASSRYRARSATDGSFVLRGLPWKMDDVTLLCRANGFALAHRPELTPTDGATDLVLQPEATLHIEVLGAATGRPLAEAELRALALTGFPEDRHHGFLRDPFVPLETTGRLVHRAGLLGTRLFVSAPGHTTRRLDVPPCLPGEERHLSVLLEPGTGFQGLVVDDLGVPVQGAEVILYPSLRLLHRVLGEPRQVTDAAGHFAFPMVPDCEWMVSVRRQGHVSRDLEPVRGGDPGPPRHVVLSRAASLGGILRDARGAPAVARWVEGKAPRDPPRSWWTLLTRTDRQGRFAAHDVRPGTWTLSVAPGVEEQIMLGPGQDVELELWLSPTLRVQGRTRSGGDPLPLVRVHASRVDPEDEMRRSSGVSTRTTTGGRFALELPLPGEYTMRFSLRQGPSIVRTLVVHEGEAPMLDVDFGTGRLAGRVMSGAPGVPLPPGVRITLMSEGMRRGRVEADAEGHFAFAPLNEGHYTLVSSPQGFLETALGPVALPDASAIAHLELVLEPAARVMGWAGDDNRQPFEGYAHLRRTDATPGYHVRAVSDGRFDFFAVEPGAWRLDLAKVRGEVLGLGEGRLGEPGLELPLIAPEERFELKGSQTVRLELFTMNPKDP